MSGGGGSKAPATATARRWSQIHHGHEARDRFVVGRANRDGFLPRAARLPVPVRAFPRKKWWLVLAPSSLLLRVVMLANATTSSPPAAAAAAAACVVVVGDVYQRLLFTVG